MRRRWFRRSWKWALIAAAIVAGWMLGSMHSSSHAQDMFETPAEYTAGPAVAVDGHGVAGRPVRAADPAFLWVPRGDHLEQWNIAASKVVTLVTMDRPPRAVVLSADGKSAYVAAGPSIAIIDTAAGSVSRKIDSPSPVTALAITPGASPRLLAAAGSVVERLDVDSNKVESVDAGGAISQLAAGGGLAFALIGDARKIVAFNGPDGAVSATWTLDAKPLAAVVDAANKRLLIACDDRQLRVLDTDAGQVVTTMPIASGTTGMCFCPAKSTLFVAGADTVDVLHADDASHYTALKSIPLPPGAHGPTIDPDGKLLTLVTGDGGKTTLCVFKRVEQ